MTTGVQDPRALMQAGVEALRRGDAVRARDTFALAARRTGPAEAPAWLGVAIANRALGDETAKLAALERVLALEPGNLRALILKGDHLQAAGDPRGAASFYSTAVKIAPPLQQLPPDLASEVRRAQAAGEGYTRAYDAFLRDHLAAAGFDSDRASPRFAQSLDLLVGKKQVYVQEPRTYYFPELPQIQFYDRGQLPWLDRVEAATHDIRGELLAVLQEEGAFTPYVEAAEDRPQLDDDGLVGNPAWSAYYLWKNGTEIPDAAARCPRTLAALAEAPLTRISNRAPSILFSLLKPGARIPPHNGLINARLICHLPLIVPPGCGFRVGNDTRGWEEGRAWAFDDTIEHEAWNDSAETRVILLFDVWRPELSLDERAMIATMFEAIDAFTGQTPEWDV